MRGKNSFIRSIFSNRKLVFGAAIFLCFVLVAIFAPVLSSHDPNRQNLLQIRLPPFEVKGGSMDHLLGTDGLGRDIFSRLVHGSRVAIIVAISSALLSALIGVPVALISGFYRGKIDTCLMRAVDIWMSLPPILLAITLMSVLGIGLVKVIIAIVLADWTRFARVVRGEVFNIREKEFIDAARIIGQRDIAIIKDEVIPNIIPVFVVVFSLEMGIAITVEVLLSFVGMGVEATTPSWGAMIAEGVGYFTVSWWGMGFPMVAIIIVLFGLNLLGDGLREILDPRLRMPEDERGNHA